MTRLQPVSDLDGAIGPGADWDCVVAVGPDLSTLSPAPLADAVHAARLVDAQWNEVVALRSAPGLCGGRLVTAPTGPLDRDYDDVRGIGAAAQAGVLRAKAAGARRPLLVVHGVPGDDSYAHALPVALLAALQGLWQPLEARENGDAAALEPVEVIGFFAADGGGDVASFCAAIEQGRRLARDLGGTEPERMAPPRFAEFCVSAFEGTGVTVQVIDDQDRITRDYPLAAAVARASQRIERHRPRIIRLEWTGAGPVHKTLLFAGKAVTYDTGGADVKAGGHMAGMSRDKGGGAAVAGFVRAAAALAPAGVRVIAEIGVVRNSIGADAYVSDEILTSHCGVRVRVGNTDAEGRMVLADLLSHLREDALGAVDPHLFSVATLTGHAVRAVGPFTASLDNGPARERKTSKIFSHVGDLWGDPFDVSRLRREDFDFVQPRSKADDVLQCNSAPSVATNRGHQFPMAFLAIASGLDRHGRFDDTPLPYTHIDVAGSATEGCDWQHGRPTGAPIVTLVRALLETPAR